MILPLCNDCSVPYDAADGWCDVVVPNEVWNTIAPEGGLLCFRCMTKRIIAHGMTDVPVIVASGPYVDANETWRLVGIEHGRSIAKMNFGVAPPAKGRKSNEDLA